MEKKKYQDIPFSFVDATGKKQECHFFVYPNKEDQTEISLENFCGVNLLMILKSIRGEK